MFQWWCTPQSDVLHHKAMSHIPKAAHGIPKPTNLVLSWCPIQWHKVWVSKSDDWFSQVSWFSSNDAWYAADIYLSLEVMCWTRTQRSVPCCDAMRPVRIAKVTSSQLQHGRQKLTVETNSNFKLRNLEFYIQVFPELPFVRYALI